MKIKLKICTQCNQEKVIWKSIGKRDKYCKQCWYQIEKPKSIPPISVKRKVEMDEYGKKRTAFLALHNQCQAKLSNCTGTSVDVHHKNGRIGDNYLNISTWMAVCRNCHNYITENSKEAVELGLSNSRLNS